MQTTTSEGRHYADWSWFPWLNLWMIFWGQGFFSHFKFTLNLYIEICVLTKIFSEKHNQSDNCHMIRFLAFKTFLIKFCSSLLTLVAILCNLLFSWLKNHRCIEQKMFCGSGCKKTRHSSYLVRQPEFETKVNLAMFLQDDVKSRKILERFLQALAAWVFLYTISQESWQN